MNILKKKRRGAYTGATDAVSIPSKVIQYAFWTNDSGNEAPLPLEWRNASASARKETVELRW